MNGLLSPNRHSISRTPPSRGGRHDPSEQSPAVRAVWRCAACLWSSVRVRGREHGLRGGTGAPAETHRRAGRSRQAATRDGRSSGGLGARDGQVAGGRGGGGGGGGRCAAGRGPRRALAFGRPKKNPAGGARG